MGSFPSAAASSFFSPMRSESRAAVQTCIDRTGDVGVEAITHEQRVAPRRAARPCRPAAADRACPPPPGRPVQPSSLRHRRAVSGTTRSVGRFGSTLVATQCAPRVDGDRGLVQLLPFKSNPCLGSPPLDRHRERTATPLLAQRGGHSISTTAGFARQDRNGYQQMGSGLGLR